MAGRPATVRGGGLTGLHYGLIAFVIISVGSLGLFIFQLTKVKAVEDQNVALQRYQDMYGTPRRRSTTSGPTTKTRPSPATRPSSRSWPRIWPEWPS